MRMWWLFLMNICAAMMVIAVMVCASVQEEDSWGERVDGEGDVERE